ncbi:MAG: ComEC/Rec2 family competence protein [Paludibacter sp.]|nr:ComEC/Rec2 family competence protein [Paludibacter sp.]
MSFLQRTPFFRLLVSLVCGIVAFQYMELFGLTRLILLIIAVSLMLISYFFHQSAQAYSLRWLFGVGVVLLFFLMGYFLSARKYQQATFTQLDQQDVFVGRLLAAPGEKNNSMACKMQVEGIYAGTKVIKEMSSPALVYVAKDSVSLQLKRGDILLFRSTFQRPSGAMNPKGFDYAVYLANKGIRATAYVRAGEWKLISHQKGFSLQFWAEQCRYKLLQIYEKLELSKDQFAVLAALTVGYTEALDPDVRESFSHSGTMHILSVSGLHVGVIYLVLQTALSLLFKKTKWKFISAVFTVCALWVYAFVTGLPPSVVRATTMFSLVAVGVALGRKSQIYNTISVSAFAILLYDPNLLFDVGFQLSYCAVIGIVWFQPKISSLLYMKQKWLKWWWDLTAVSLAAQIATLPLVLYYFHQFPNYFLLANYVAIPLSTFIIYLAVAFLILFPVSWLAFIPRFLLKSMLWLLNASVDFFHDLPYAISICYLNFFQLFLLFAVLVFFSFYLENKKYWSLMATLCILLGFVLSHVLVHYQTSKLNQLVVYADRKHTHVNLITRHHHQVITTDSTAAFLSASNYWEKCKLHNPEYKIIHSSGFFSFQGKKILILTDSLLHRKTTHTPIKTDFLIIGNGLKPRAKELLSCVTPKNCIADQSISPWYVDQLRESCRAKRISFYSVAEQGAFIYDFKQADP